MKQLQSPVPPPVSTVSTRHPGSIQRCCVSQRRKMAQGLHCTTSSLLGWKSDNSWQKKGQPMPDLSDPVWLTDFGLLVGITRHLNTLNTSIKGQNAVVSELYSHIKAFGIKLQLFWSHLSQTQPNTTHFPALHEVMASFSQNDISVQMRRCAADISSLAEEFQQRFLDFAAIEKEITLFYSIFSVDPDDAPDHRQLELIEPQSRHQQQLDKGRFQEIWTFAKKTLSLFGWTYLCEETFSVMTFNKNRVRTRLSVSHLHDILHIKTTVFEPDLAYLQQLRSQYHPSHECRQVICLVIWGE